MFGCYMCLFGDKCNITTLWVLIMAHHDLKQFTDHFLPILQRKMRAVVRRNDRNFQVGDTVTLREGEPDATEEGGFKYTDKEVSAVITYIDNFGCEPGNVCLSLGRVGLTIVHKD